MYKNIFGILLASASLGLALTACEDQPEKFELTDGTPVIHYIRPQDVASKDSLLVEAYTQTPICIVGENLTSIQQMYFNDVKATLNTSYITKNTMLVTIPSDIPENNTGKIYMINKSKDTTTYDFKVLVPAPTVSTMKCEYVAVGSEATVTGQYFVNDPNDPLTITFIGVNNSIDVPVTDIKEITASSLRFIVPEGAEEGQIKVHSIYGDSKSKFYYNDRRGIITDFEGENHAGPTGVIPQGWTLQPPTARRTAAAAPTYR